MDQGARSAEGGGPAVIRATISQTGKIRDDTGVHDRALEVQQQQRFTVQELPMVPILSLPKAVKKSEIWRGTYFKLCCS